ncbi:MAG: hypothetical protein FJ038_03915 [Chloroflexi bacterium]|nr:hypothetical protein [Chloroflexota bacterium]
MAEEGEIDLAAIAEYMKNQAREKYPQMAWALNHPEVGPLLQRAAAEGWDAARFQGELLKTQWYKSTTDSARVWERLLNEDPATAAKTLDRKVRDIQTLAGRIGLTGIDFNAWQPGWVFAVDATRETWDETRIVQELLSRWGTGGTDAQQGGQLGGMMDSVKGTAAQYLTPITDDAAYQMASKMLYGTLDQAGMAAYFKDQAVIRFSGNEQVLNMLNNGFTPREIFQPLVQQTAQLLELAPAQVDLMDPKWQGMLDYTDPQTNTVRPMTQTEAGRYVRGLDEYRQTDGAVRQASEFAEFIGQKMGAVA